jgi:hypothetical protein
MNKKDEVKLLEKEIKGKPIYAILLCILAIVLIGFLFLIGLIISDKYQIGVGKEYELFRDILAILLTITGIAVGTIGYAMYRTISEHLENTMSKKIDVFTDYSYALLNNNIGFSYWLRYDETHEKIAKARYLETAIMLTLDAYRHVCLLDETEQRNELLKCKIMNNLGYYLATRKNEGDRSLAISCAEFIINRIDKYHKERDAWEDTSRHITNRYPPL